MMETRDPVTQWLANPVTKNPEAGNGGHHE